MRVLHTSDWHVGKAIRGHSRAGEHRAVLAEMAAIAGDEAVDLVVVAGDLFDTAAPTAEAEAIVYDALLSLAEAAPVVVIAGNHDSGRRLDAVSKLLALGRVTVATAPRPPSDGGVIELTGSGGPVRVATVPFVSQRAIVRAEALMDNPAFRNAQTYSERLRAVIAALCAGFSPDAVNLVVAHAFVAGGAVGGGERPAHLVDEYAVSAVDFPPTASYVALGHLHRAQAIAGGTAIHYCGSPLQLDFGEVDETKQVNVVDVEPGLPAKVRAVPLRSGRRLVTLQGSLDQVRDAAAGDSVGDAWIRVRIDEAQRAGLADEVRSLLGERVVDVRIDRPVVSGRTRTSRSAQRSPTELFGAYLDERDVADPRLTGAFAALYDELHQPDDPLDVDAAEPAAPRPAFESTSPEPAPTPTSPAADAAEPAAPRPAFESTSPEPAPSPGRPAERVAEPTIAESASPTPSPTPPADAVAERIAAEPASPEPLVAAAEGGPPAVDEAESRDEEPAGVAEPQQLSFGA